MNILVYTTAKYPTNSGAGKNAFNFARSLKKHAKKLTLVALEHGAKKRSQTKCENIECIGLPFNGSSGLSKRLSKIPIIPALIPLILSHDVFLIYSTPPGYKTMILLAGLLGKKVILRSTSLDQDDMPALCNKYGKVLYPLNKMIFSRLHRYFSINTEFERRYKSIFPKKNNVFLSVQGVDLKKFPTSDKKRRSEIRRELGFSDDELIIASTGYLLLRKGYKESTDALKSLNRDYTYLIMGDYKQNPNDSYHKNWSEDRIKEMKDLHKYMLDNLGDKVKFLGPVSNVADVLAVSDIFLHNSYAEGTPNVVMEAMACGLPVIMRDLPGMKEFLIFHGENGYLIHNFGELKNTLEKLMDSPEERERIGKKALEICQVKFDQENVVNRLLESL